MATRKRQNVTAVDATFSWQVFLISLLHLLTLCSANRTYGVVSRKSTSLFNIMIWTKFLVLIFSITLLFSFGDGRGGGIGRIAGKVGRKIGPSGKPVYHNIMYTSRKAAEEGARRKGEGKPAFDLGKNGGRDHFHPVNRDGKRVRDGSHHAFGKKKP